MPFDSTTFWSSVAGAALPSLAVGVAIWALTSRTNRSLARYQAQLSRDSEATRIWQSHRVEALIEVYDAFRQHLDFLRRFFYWPETDSKDVTPLHEFHKRLEKVLVFFDEDAAAEIRVVQGELLTFWNWAIERISQPETLQEVRHRLDFDIPGYLDRIRQFVNREALRAPRLPPEIRTHVPAPA
jgi:hypothetical protein